MKAIRNYNNNKSSASSALSISQKKYKAVKQQPSSNKGDFAKRSEESIDSYLNLTRKLTTTDDQEVELVYSDINKSVTAYVKGNNGQQKLIKPDDMPKELRSIKDPFTFEFFLENAYGKITTLSNGDIKLYVEQRGLGGGKEESNIHAVQYLLDDSTDINARDNEGNTRLLLAVKSGNEEVVLDLIEKGADINAKDNDGNTLLILAAYSGLTEAAIALIEKGADINAKDNDSYTSLLWAVYNGLTEVVLALIEKGADINAKTNDGNTPLIVAAREGHTELALALIEKGADINAKTDHGSTPLLVASQYGYIEVVKHLINEGADITAKDKDGDTALICAAYGGFPVIAELLISKGADIETKNERGKTALEIAKDRDNKGVTEYLQSKITEKAIAGHVEEPASPEDTTIVDSSQIIVPKTDVIGDHFHHTT